jgi:hypothetical protein
MVFCVSGLSILDYLLFTVSLDCLYLITSMIVLCLWIVYTWLPLWFFCVSGVSILDYLYGIFVSLDCLYLIISMVFLPNKYSQNSPECRILTLEFQKISRDKPPPPPKIDPSALNYFVLFKITIHLFSKKLLKTLEIQKNWRGNQV